MPAELFLALLAQLSPDDMSPRLQDACRDYVKSLGFRNRHSYLSDKERDALSMGIEVLGMQEEMFHYV